MGARSLAGLVPTERANAAARTQNGARLRGRVKGAARLLGQGRRSLHVATAVGTREAVKSVWKTL